jgi:ankyrin repeat protein
LLIGAGADVNSADAAKTTPLQLAAAEGDLSLVRLLIARGADVKHRDWKGDTALHKATTKAVAECLIAHGAEVNRADDDGSIPLHFAANAAVAEALLAAGAHLDQRDKEGETPLLAAAAGEERQERLDVARLLVARGADVGARDSRYGFTALDWAIKNNDAELVHRLLDRGVQQRAASFTSGGEGKAQRKTPLLLAAENGGMEAPNADGSGGPSANRGPTTIARLLLDRGADLSARDEMGKTPLIGAALVGDDVMVPLLIQRGADLEAKDKDGYTALHWAAWNWQTSVVRLLIAHGANVNARNNKGETPLDLARSAARIVGSVEGSKQTPVQLLLDATARKGL